jgi:hypothetical protein
MKKLIGWVVKKIEMLINIYYDYKANKETKNKSTRC